MSTVLSRICSWLTVATIKTAKDQAEWWQYRQQASTLLRKQATSDFQKDFGDGPPQSDHTTSATTATRLVVSSDFVFLGRKFLLLETNARRERQTSGVHAKWNHGQRHTHFWKEKTLLSVRTTTTHRSLRALGAFSCARDICRPSWLVEYVSWHETFRQLSRTLLHPQRSTTEFTANAPRAGQRASNLQKRLHGEPSPPEKRVTCRKRLWSSVSRTQDDRVIPCWVQVCASCPQQDLTTFFQQRVANRGGLFQTARV